MLTDVIIHFDEAYNALFELETGGGVLVHLDGQTVIVMRIKQAIVSHHPTIRNATQIDFGDEDFGLLAAMRMEPSRFRQWCNQVFLGEGEHALKLCIERALMACGEIKRIPAPLNALERLIDAVRAQGVADGTLVHKAHNDQ